MPTGGKENAPAAATAMPAAGATASGLAQANAGALAAVQPTAAGPAPAAQPGVPAHAASPAATPAQQLAPAVLTLAGQGGDHRLSVSLSPDQLGTVGITIERAADGTTNIHVTAERLETLHLLQKDQADLTQSLNQAGIGQDGRTLSFSWSGDGGRSGWAGQGGGQAGGQGSGQGTYASNPYNDEKATVRPAALPREAAQGRVDITA